MIAVDTNLLVYAHLRDAACHEAAADRVRELAEGEAPWAIPWPCVHEFLAIATHPAIYHPPTPLGRALDQVDAWLESPSLVLLPERGGHWERLREVTQEAKASGPGSTTPESSPSASSTACGSSGPPTATSAGSRGWVPGIRCPTTRQMHALYL